MKKTMWMASFLIAGAGAIGANAAPVQLNGSDTVFVMINQALTACSIDATNGAVYVGGGSTTGEAGMIAQTQEVAGMSRYLRARATNKDVCLHPEQGRNAEGIAWALDGLSLTADSDWTANCGGGDGLGGLRIQGNIPVQDLNVNNTTGLPMPGLQCGGGACPATYALGTLNAAAGDLPGSEWKDLLRVLYHGLHNNNVRDCNSDVRWTLINNWAQLFETNCPSCDRVEFLFRRADLSGTTDTFLGIIGGGAFCNGTDEQDNDPIRRSCMDPKYDTYNELAVCNTYLPQVLNAASGTPERTAQAARRWSLGVLQPILPPTAGSFDGDEDYPTTFCATNPGPARAAPYLDVATFQSWCPCGEPISLGRCRAPRDASSNAGCIVNNVFAGRPVGFGIPAECDFRVYNYAVRKDNGNMSTDPEFSPPRQRLAAGYRMQWRPTGPNPVCNDEDATTQIGCLAQAMMCTIGFGGREVCDPQATTGNDCLEVNNVEPTIATVQNFSYPISRELYLTSIPGFDCVATGTCANVGSRTAAQFAAEAQLAGCVSHSPTINPIVSGNGFVEMPAGATCRDFPETMAPNGTTGIPGGCSLPAPENNACAGNPVVNVPGGIGNVQLPN